MRHSRIELTMNYRTDPAPFDVAGAMNSLPDFSSGQGDTNGRAAKGAQANTSTDRKFDSA